MKNYIWGTIIVGAGIAAAFSFAGPTAGPSSVSHNASVTVGDSRYVKKDGTSTMTGTLKTTGIQDDSGAGRVDFPDQTIGTSGAGTPCNVASGLCVDSYLDVSPNINTSTMPMLFIKNRNTAGAALTYLEVGGQTVFQQNGLVVSRPGGSAGTLSGVGYRCYGTSFGVSSLAGKCIMLGGSSGTDIAVGIGQYNNIASSAPVMYFFDSVISPDILGAIYGTGMTSKRSTPPTCTDSSNGSPGALNLDPQTGVTYITNADADGCVVTMQETTAAAIVATTGYSAQAPEHTVCVVSNAGGNVTFPDVANVFNCNATVNAGVAVDGCFTMVYGNNKWLCTGNSAN